MASRDRSVAFETAVFLVLAAMASILLSVRSRAQSATGSQGPKTATGKAKAPGPLSPEEKQAQLHYRIALVAIKNNDLVTASNELKSASELAPNNALIWYNLAVVESKNGSPALALDHLEKATDFGLPPAIQSEAEDLQAKLGYEREKRKMNPRILLGQDFMISQTCGAADGLEMGRDSFLKMIANFLGSKDNIEYAKYSDLGSGVLKQSYEDSGYLACDNACFEDTKAQNPALTAKFRTNYVVGDVHYGNFADFAQYECDKKCAHYKDRATEIGKNLQDLNYDALLIVDSYYRCAWNPLNNSNVVPEQLDLKYMQLDSWADFKLELITSEGKYLSPNLTVYLHSLSSPNAYLILADPQWTFGRSIPDLRSSLVRLMYDAGFHLKESNSP